MFKKRDETQQFCVNGSISSSKFQKWRPCMESKKQLFVKNKSHINDFLINILQKHAATTTTTTTKKNHTPHTLPKRLSLKGFLGRSLGRRDWPSQCHAITTWSCGRNICFLQWPRWCYHGDPKIIKDTMEIIGDPLPTRDLQLLRFNFFLLALDLGMFGPFLFEAQVHHMRAVSCCSPTLLFQLVHDPVPQRNSQIFNCLKLEVIKLKGLEKYIANLLRIHKKEKREH